MSYRKKTLRQMPEQTRKLAKVIGELDSVSRKLKNQLLKIEELERWYLAEQKRQSYYKGKGKPDDSNSDLACL